MRRLTDMAVAAYERAQEPKKLAIIPGGHFDAYTVGFDYSAGAATTWFQQHLQGRALASRAVGAAQG